MKRTMYPNAIALPSWKLNDLRPYLEQLTEEFAISYQEVMGGAGNVRIEVAEWMPEEYENDDYQPNSFDLPIYIDVEFADDVHQVPDYQEPMSFRIILRGLQNFALDPSTMVTYQIFHVDTVVKGNGKKRDYETIYMRLIDYIASKKVASY